MAAAAAAAAAGGAWEEAAGGRSRVGAPGRGASSFPLTSAMETNLQHCRIRRRFTTNLLLRFLRRRLRKALDFSLGPNQVGKVQDYLDLVRPPLCLSVSLKKVAAPQSSSVLIYSGMRINSQPPASVAPASCWYRISRRDPIINPNPSQLVLAANRLEQSSWASVISNCM
uniref:Uncharacterized protein n=1 Tax=Oryza sativa subsp. japonica TaxID=39947 RepID=Q6K9N2_ORYSJ|nr:hypothetical protein [Oryza sativa Japonica Group]